MNVRRLLDFLRRLQLARQRYGRAYLALVADFVDLYLRRKFTAKEIFLCDMLRPEPWRQRQASTASKSTLVRLQQKLNPEHALPLVEDKSVFYSACRDRRLPIPKLLALWTVDGGMTADGSPLTSDRDWVDFLETMTAEELVIKPSLGVYGRGIRFLSRAGDLWRPPSGRCLTAKDILRDLREDRDYQSFVMQERVMPHASLIALSATRYLQTMRLVTGVRGEQDVEILLGEQRIVCGDAVISNFAWGETGNAVSDVDLEGGRVISVLSVRGDGIGMDPIVQHPTTGRSFDNFPVPCWREACDLCKRAAVDFLPLRTVGWDVAATDSGPVLLEGNAFWDPHNRVRRMGPFLRYARDMGCEPGIWS